MEQVLTTSGTGFQPGTLVPDLLARRLAVVAGWILIGTGLIGALGWGLGTSVLVEPLRAFPALSFSGAVALVALGTGLLGLSQEHRTAMITGGLGALLLAASTLIAIVIGDSDPQAMVLGADLTNTLALPPSSALLLAFVGAGVLAPALTADGSRGRFLAGTFGGIAVAFCLGVLLIRSLWAPALGGGILAGSPLQTLAGAALAGASLVFVAWSGDPENAPSAAWIPVAVGVACLVTVFFLWRALVTYQQDQVRLQTVIAARAARREVQRQVETASRAIARIGRYSPEPRPTEPRWANAMVALTRDVDGLRGMAWVDRTGVIRAFHPTPIPSDTSALQIERRLREARIAAPASSPSDVIYFTLSDSLGLFAAAVPTCDSRSCTGWVVGVVDAVRMIQPVLSLRAEGYNFQLAVRGHRLVGPRETTLEQAVWIERLSLAVGDQTWDFAVWPQWATLQRLHSGLPDLVLILGLLVTALMPSTLVLAQMTLGRARLEERVRLNTALESATDTVWDWDIGGGQMVHGEAFWRRLGYGLTGRVRAVEHWMALVHPDDRRRLEVALDSHLEGRSPSFEAEYRLQGADGRWHWMVDRGRVVARSPAGQPTRMLGITADVTEARQSQLARDASERRFREMFDSGFQAKLLLDQEGRVIEVNRAALVEAHTERQEVVGRPAWEILWWGRDRGAGPRLEEAIHRALDPGAGAIRYTEEIREGGRVILIVELAVKRIESVAGQPPQILLEARDITSRRRAEAALQEVDILTTMGGIAARVAHEINNPLAGIQNAFLLIKNAVPVDHPHARYVGAIEREIGRIAGVTRQLYETYRPEPSDSRGTAVSGLIADAVTMLETVNRDAGVRITVDTSGVPDRVPLPDALVRQAVYNLVQNAVEVSPAGGVVAVRTTIEDQTFVLSVQDQGPGVPEDIRARIFEPFFTTKPTTVRTSGMGMGLSLVHRSVQAFGGRVELIDLPGGGTEFIVRLPLSPNGSGENA